MTDRPILRRLAAATLLVLVAVLSSACIASSPTQAGDLRFEVENRTDVPHEIDARSSGPGLSTEIAPHAIDPRAIDTTTVPLVETWSVRIDGRLILSSVDRPDLAVEPGRRTDLVVTIVITDAGVELGPVRFAPPADPSK